MFNGLIKTFQASVHNFAQSSVLKGVRSDVSLLSTHYSTKGLCLKNGHQGDFSEEWPHSCPFPALPCSTSAELQHTHQSITQPMAALWDVSALEAGGRRPRKRRLDKHNPVLPVISFFEVPSQLTFGQDVVERGLRTFICYKNHNR